jgi:hypothetical protein
MSKLIAGERIVTIVVASGGGWLANRLDGSRTRLPDLLTSTSKGKIYIRPGD